MVNTEQWVDEIHEGTMRFGLKAKAVLFDHDSDFQRVTIIDTEALGRALLLDGLWMTAEGDEKTYHELITHPALVTAPSIARVLIIGGGDGGTAREVLRHREVERVDMVEVDGLVVKACQELLPTIGSAWHDPRLNVIIGDGARHVAEAAPGSYDVILVDGADPIGPAVTLFEEDFFTSCARALTPDGVFVTQGGSPTVQGDVHLEMIRTMRGVFKQVAPLYSSVSIYPGATWSWIWATPGDLTPDMINEERVAAIEPHTWLYNRHMHQGVFAIPNHIAQALGHDR